MCDPLESPLEYLEDALDQTFQADRRDGTDHVPFSWPKLLRLRIQALIDRVKCTDVHTDADVAEALVIGFGVASLYQLPTIQRTAKTTGQ